MAFDDDFALLTGNKPFPWQRALYEHFGAGEFPKVCDLPTGLGKTSVIALWVLALSKNPQLPRRLVYVVNRRTVVDQATAEAERLRERLASADARHLRHALDEMAALPAKSPLAISTLRGEFADNAQWRRDPSRPAVIVGTVDMVGSRLLFSGYGCGFRSKPLHAGFLGHDALLVHDEAHLEPAFQSLVSSIVAEQQSRELRPLKLLALSATGRETPDFSLGAEDLRDAKVQQRLSAKKGLQLHLVEDRNELPEQIAAKAASLEGKVIVFLSSVEHAEKCAQALRKTHKDAVATLTGTMRGAERDELVKNTVFARFLPRPGEGVKVKHGTVFVVATSAGEVGIDLSADHLVTDLPPFDALAQRLGRVNRYGDGDAQVHVFVEKLKEPAKPKADGDDSEEGDEKPGKRKDDLEHARYFTRELLRELPSRADELLDVSPAALRGLPRDARLKASSPQPDLRHVDGLLFDRWSYTTITAPLPGRQAVAEWLHGVAEWEPPRTTVAWRSEVTWLTQELLGRATLEDFLADYPLRSRETLNDVTSRVLKHLEKLASREENAEANVWLVRHDAGARMVKLRRLLDDYDSKRNPTLDGATVVLPPQIGGLSGGLLDGSAGFNEEQVYDLGPREGERSVYEAEARADTPNGMRLVRAVKREVDGDEVTRWWQLYAVSLRADDDGSRTATSNLPLDVHLQRTEAWAARIGKRLGLGDAERKALARAGLVHDLGKRRRVWQRSIKNYKEPALAKGVMQPSELGGYRHELGSIHDADFSGLSDDEKDLAIHAVAAHHGRARPHFPTHESFDPEVKDEVIAPLVFETPLRFDRLQRRYGRWGLAWLESILRAADVLGSEDEELAE